VKSSKEGRRLRLELSARNDFWKRPLWHPDRRREDGNDHRIDGGKTFITNGIADATLLAV
jgi:hypothetical protein